LQAAVLRDGVARSARDGWVMRASGDHEVALFRRRGGGEQEVSRWRLDAVPPDVARRAVSDHRRIGDRVTLVAPGGTVLERPTTLPLAAANTPDAVLRYELDRLMPFPLAAMAWGWRIEARDAARGRVVFRVRAVPLAPLAPVVEAAQALGLEPDVVEAEGADGTTWPLMLGDRRMEARAASPRAFRLAALACAGLAAATLLVPAWQQWKAEAELDAALATLRPAAAEADALARRLAGEADGSEILRREMARIGSPLALIAALTDLLPDETFLAELSIGNGQVVLRGQSANAARLVPTIAASQTLRAPGFIAPVRRNEDGAGELFVLRADHGAGP
jgi:general secretion pathway protein L